jgi:hypothetical protein
MAIYMWREYIPPELCFTANTANSTVQLTKTGSPTVVTLETSTDWSTWTDYTIWDTITLSSIWDKVYIRNKSETPTGFSTATNSLYKFVMSGSISASWDVNYLLCKDSTTDLTASGTLCFYRLFHNCANLTTAPKLPATILTNYCYYQMFYGCTNLEQLTSLSAISLKNECYRQMFYGCSKIKLSTTQTWEYQTEYRVPTTWTWTVASDWNTNMIAQTWWTFLWPLAVNTTYYTSNTVI